MHITHYLWAMSTLFFYLNAEYVHCSLFLKIDKNIEKYEVLDIQSNKKIIGSGYSIMIPNNWVAKQLDSNQVFIKGAKVNNVYSAIYITKWPKNGKNYIDAANRMKIQQSKNIDYTLLSEKDISKLNLNALLRRSSWYSSNINMKLFIREIYTQNDTDIFIISASIPMVPDLETLDEHMVSILSTFKFLP
ncbi:hypothetical protein [Aquimarina agarilytica]|uniref:hypothetical protein n=1 Tax=Aquimarina agarilytica TaxID=1087449 RepID=UPI000287B80A|nr:hypothetical protein [Aquimarina agarilytica]